MVEKGKLAVLKVAVFSKPKYLRTPKLVYMHVTSASIFKNFLSRFRSIKFFYDHGL